MNLPFSLFPTAGIPEKIPINASGLKISACPRRWFFSVYLGLKPPEDTTNLVVGKIIHKFIERLALDRSPDGLMAAMQEGYQAMRELPAKDQDQIKKTFSACPSDQLPRPLLIADQTSAEYKFEFKIDGFENFYYMGTVDLITRLGLKKTLTILDTKTTRYYKLADAVSKYEGDPQFTFYYWILRNKSYEIFKGDMDTANDAWYGRMVAKTMVVQIALPQPAWRLNTPEWSFTEEQLDKFGTLVKDFTALRNEDIEVASKSGLIPPATGMINNSCPSCPFKALCFATQPAAVDNFLNSCKIEQYKPLSW